MEEADANKLSIKSPQIKEWSQFENFGDDMSSNIITRNSMNQRVVTKNLQESEA